jgi:HK97 family phage portal protein
MARWTTPTGLVVTDRRHTRSDYDDPRSWPPNSNINPPPPDQPGVGPNMSEGFGNQHVMYPADQPAVYAEPALPPPVMPWSGWPVEWSTPTWGSGAGGWASMVARISVVFGCIDLNSSLLSTMPPYRVVNQVVQASLPWMRNPQPEVYTGWIEAMKQVVAAYWGGGEAFLWCTSRYSDNSVRTWVMLNPEWVSTEMFGQTRRHYLGNVGQGPDITDDVLHLRYSSWPGVARGVGPLEALANNIVGVEAMERYQSQLASRGGIPWGVLTSPGNLTRDQAEEQRTAFVNARLSAMGAPAVLSGGVTLTPFNITPRDMALLELRQMDEARISTVLGVPPMLMGLPSGGDSMTYRNADSIYDFHWRAYLRPKAAYIGEAISQWALPGQQNIEFNRDEYTRPSLDQRAVIYNTLFNIFDPITGERALTIDEIRAQERFVDEDAAEDEDEVRPQQLAALGAPQEAIWEAAGISPAEIQRWKDMKPTPPPAVPPQPGAAPPPPGQTPGGPPGG